MKIWPTGKSESNAPPLSVTVCRTLPLCQHTDCPWVIVMLAGEKLLELVVLTFAFAPLFPHEFAVLVGLLLQAAAASKPKPIPRANSTRMNKASSIKERWRLRLRSYLPRVFKGVPIS